MGDTFQHAALARSADWFGNPGTLPNMGAPAGVDWSSFPTGGERLHMVILGGITSVTGDVWLAANIHLLIVLALTAVCAFLVIRWMGASDLLAGAAGLVFTFLPAAYHHVALGHPFLVGLYPVPLSIYLALRWTKAGLSKPTELVGIQTSGRSRLSVLGPSVLAVLLIGLSSTYYSMMAAMLISGLGLLMSVKHRRPRDAAGPMAVAIGILAVLGLSTLPHLLGTSRAAVMDRRLSDSLTYALQPAQLFLPQPGHLIGPLARLGGDSSVALGLAGSIGLILLGWHTLDRIGRPSKAGDPVLDRLTALVALCFAIGVAGGLGWVMARFLVRDFRVWSRVAVFIAFCGIAAIVLTISLLTENRTEVVATSPTERASTPDPPIGSSGSPQPRWWMVAVVAVVLLALFDQRSQLPTADFVEADMAEDTAVVQELQDALPAGSRVLEWPSVAFPDHFGSERLLAPALLSDDSLDMEFSAGAFRGGPSDWQQSWVLEDVPDQLSAAAAAGFDAVLIQVDHHLWRDVELLLSEARSALGPPEGVSANGTWQWFDLRGLQARQKTKFTDVQLDTFASQMLRPVGLTVSGTPGFPSTGSERDFVLGPSGTVGLRSYDDDESSLLVAFKVAAASGSEVRIDSGSSVQVLTPGPGGQEVVVAARVSRGRGGVRISVDGNTLREEVGKPAVFAEIGGLQVFDEGLASSPVLIPESLR